MNQNDRHYRWYDHFFSSAQKCLQAVNVPSPATTRRNNPSINIPEQPLSLSEKNLSSSLMRVNHVGEVCAQALYIAQSFTATEKSLRDSFEQAATEEIDHLHWCQERLTELGSHHSYLNPLWFMGSLMIGACAGLAGSGYSLGFLAETEQQVFDHLASHLEKLPQNDEKSRAIVKQMQIDEKKHATTAVELGAKELPFSVKIMMRSFAKIMTSVAYYV
ncbi:MAG: 2-polyprenyl-3-methyl-6-methoxy-1,4-benzoquinone monooxygenase [Candidatus Berkiellales bacterium]